MERLKEAALEKIRCVCVYTEVRGMAQCIYPLFFLGRLLFSFFFFSYLQDSNQRPHFHHSHCKRETSRILNSYFIGLFPSTRKSTKCSTGFWTLDGANIVIFFLFIQILLHHLPAASRYYNHSKFPYMVWQPQTE